MSTIAPQHEPTTRSGTRTPSSTSCTSGPSTTATATASATSPGLTAKLDYLQDLGVDCLWLLPFYPSPLRDDGYDIADYRAIHPDYGTVDDFERFLERGPRARHPGHHRAGDQPHLRPAPLVPGGARATATRPSATTTSGATPTSGTADARIIFTRHRDVELDLGPGRQGRTTGTASSATSPTSTTTTPRCASEMLDVMRFWLDRGVDGFRVRRRALPVRARGHELREPARDARLPQASCARAIDARVPGTACCWPRPTSGRPTCAPTSATATSSTWRSTSR